MSVITISIEEDYVENGYTYSLIVNTKDFDTANNIINKLISNENRLCDPDEDEIVKLLADNNIQCIPVDKFYLHEIHNG